MHRSESVPVDAVKKKFIKQLKTFRTFMTRRFFSYMTTIDTSWYIGETLNSANNGSL